MHIIDALKERGMLAQVTFEEELRDRMGKSMTYYCGFDPTADSLHVGHYIPIMAMAHLQRAGHRPIILVGGGTGMVGDPSGRTDLRKMLTEEDIQHNVECLKDQISRFLSFEGENAAIVVNNADWLLKLNYVEFLRDVGVHFSVNRMLTADCYRQRMEQGLTFLEFNYMLMQSYDFLVLHQKFNCELQVGGDDQWSNMIAGADLIRRKEQKPAFILTMPLLLTSDGRKMGKSASGAVWLNEKRTSPYDFYQYWRNVDDADVHNCLARLTFLPMDEVNALSALQDSQINEAKKVLAYEVTKLVHGQEAAEQARTAAEALFSGSGNMQNVPTVEVDLQSASSMQVIDLFVVSGLCASKGEVRRLVAGGGAYLDGEKCSTADEAVAQSMLAQGECMLRKGKKDYRRIKFIP